MDIQANILNVRMPVSLEPVTGGGADAREGLDEVDYRGARSASEQVLRGVVSRLNRLIAGQDDISVAVKGVAQSQGAVNAESSAVGHGLSQGFKARHAGSLKVQLAVAELLDKVQASKVARHIAYADLSKLYCLDLSLDPEVQALSLRGLAGLPQEVRDGTRSSDDFFEKLQGMIGFIKEEYLAVYENLLGKYSEFYKEFNEKFMAQMKEFIREAAVPGEIIVYVDVMERILQELLDKYKRVPEGVLYPTDGGPVSRSDAVKWANAMGLPLSCVVGGGVSGWRVMMDLSIVDAIKDGLPNKNHSNGAIIDSASFQAWQTGFGSLEDGLKNLLQVYTTKYSNANSYHENFNKILSSQLSQYAEMLKQIVSGIA